MISKEDLKGVDFDWFARDAQGQVALFATAGAVLVPSEVLRSPEIHESISDSIPTPNWNTDAVWDDYANLGLHAFDWRGDSYVKVRSPAPGTAFVMADASVLPRLDLSFSECTEIPWEALSHT